MNPFERIDQLTKEKRSMEIAALKLADDYDALKSDLARMTAEREECRAFWTAEADKAATRTTELVRNSAYWEAEATALRARVAELEAVLRNARLSLMDCAVQFEARGMLDLHDIAAAYVDSCSATCAESTTPAKDEGVSHE